MSGPRIAVFAPAEAGHFRRLVPLMEGLSRRGARVEAWTHARFRADAERSGASFVDLFGRFPPGVADDESLPVPSRSVAFAGHYAEDVAEALAADRPALILYDTFAVVGHVVARLLEIPYVNVCAGHNVGPALLPSALRDLPRVFTSPRCHAAVERLRVRHGIAEASPFFYMAATSPFLNVYCEPAQYLVEPERQVFEPLAFFGCLPEAEAGAAPGHAGPAFPGAQPGELRVYVSFGTVVWRYFEAQALDALRTIAAALSARPGVRTLVTLGGRELSAAGRASLDFPRVTVVTYADQRAVLREADVFVTHHGMNSTHEAIEQGVPMLSYPFFWDQPSLARKCRDFGIALPLCATPRGPLRGADVHRALDEVVARGLLQAELARARDWEREVLAGRGEVFERILRLADS